MQNQIKFRFKLKAFTLLEIIIAMVLSFFILSILYLMYDIMGRHFQNEYEKQLSGLVILKSQLEMDFFHTDTIITDQKQIHLFLLGKESSYQFQEDAILKKANLITDTVFKGEYIPEIETIQNKDWVKRLILKIKTQEEDVELTFNKSYYPNQKLKSKEINFEY